MKKCNKFISHYFFSHHPFGFEKCVYRNSAIFYLLLLAVFPNFRTVNFSLSFLMSNQISASLQVKCIILEASGIKKFDILAMFLPFFQVFPTYLLSLCLLISNCLLNFFELEVASMRKILQFRFCCVFEAKKI